MDECSEIRIKGYDKQIRELREKLKLCKNHIMIDIYNHRIDFFEKLKKELETCQEIV